MENQFRKRFLACPEMIGSYFSQARIRHAGMKCFRPKRKSNMETCPPAMSGTRSNPMTDTVRELFMKLQDEYRREVVPRYPLIVVRVLGKEVKVGRIWIPDSDWPSIQPNKPALEAIVLCTYEPFTKIINKQEVLFRPQVKEGDHVLFHHASVLQGQISLGSKLAFIDEKDIYGVITYTRIEGEEPRSMTMSGGLR
jgi:co-chaperonin GroES (HSP10)